MKGDAGVGLGVGVGVGVGVSVGVGVGVGVTVGVGVGVGVGVTVGVGVGVGVPSTVYETRMLPDLSTASKVRRSGAWSIATTPYPLQGSRKYPSLHIPLRSVAQRAPSILREFGLAK